MRTMNAVDLLPALPLLALPFVSYVWATSPRAIGQRVAGALGSAFVLAGSVLFGGALPALGGTSLVAAIVHAVSLKKQPVAPGELELGAGYPDLARALGHELSVEKNPAADGIHAFQGLDTSVSPGGEALPAVDLSDLTGPLPETARDIHEIVSEMHAANNGVWDPTLDFLTDFLIKNGYFGNLTADEARGCVARQTAILVGRGYIKARAVGQGTLELIPAQSLGGS